MHGEQEQKTIHELYAPWIDAANKIIWGGDSYTALIDEKEKQDAVQLLASAEWCTDGNVPRNPCGQLSDFGEKTPEWYINYAATVRELSFLAAFASQHGITIMKVDHVGNELLFKKYENEEPSNAPLFPLFNPRMDVMSFKRALSSLLRSVEAWTNFIHVFRNARI